MNGWVMEGLWMGGGSKCLGGARLDAVVLAILLQYSRQYIDWGARSMQ